jgi:hypothetical protein
MRQENAVFGAAKAAVNVPRSLGRFGTRLKHCLVAIDVLLKGLVI